MLTLERVVDFCQLITACAPRYRSSTTDRSSGREPRHRNLPGLDPFTLWSKDLPFPKKAGSRRAVLSDLAHRRHCRTAVAAAIAAANYASLNSRYWSQGGHYLLSICAKAPARVLKIQAW